MLNYDRRYLDWYLEKNKMAKKKIIPKFSFEKFVKGGKRPAIALVTATFVAWGVGDVFAGMIAGIVVERLLMTAVWLINKK